MFMSKYIVVTPTDVIPSPDEYEMTAARLLADYFQSDVTFIKRSSHQTPDLTVAKTYVRWEIKTIEGNSKRTIQNNLRKADRQSENIVISLIRTEMNATQAKGRINEFLRDGPTRIRRIILITKTQKILVIK